MGGGGGGGGGGGLFTLVGGPPWGGWPPPPPPPRLLYKLSNYGINNVTLTWLKRFLSNRKQWVVLEGAMSDQVPVSSGVPQGLY